MCVAPVRWPLTTREGAPLIPVDDRGPQPASEQALGSPDIQRFRVAAHDHRDQVCITGQPSSRARIDEVPTDALTQAWKLANLGKFTDQGLVVHGDNDFRGPGDIPGGVATAPIQHPRRNTDQFDQRVRPALTRRARVPLHHDRHSIG